MCWKSEFIIKFEHAHLRGTCAFVYIDEKWNLKRSRPPIQRKQPELIEQSSLFLLEDHAKAQCETLLYSMLLRAEVSAKGKWHDYKVLWCWNTWQISYKFESVSENGPSSGLHWHKHSCVCLCVCVCVLACMLRCVLCCMRAYVHGDINQPIWRVELIFSAWLLWYIGS